MFLLACFPSLVSAFFSLPLLSVKLFACSGKNDYWELLAHRGLIIWGLRNKESSALSLRIPISLWKGALFDFVWVPCSPLNSTKSRCLDNQLELPTHGVLGGAGLLSDSQKEILWNRSVWPFVNSVISSFIYPTNIYWAPTLCSRHCFNCSI